MTQQEIQDLALKLDIFPVEVNLLMGIPLNDLTQAIIFLETHPFERHKWHRIKISQQITGMCKNLEDVISSWKFIEKENKLELEVKASCFIDKMTNRLLSKYDLFRVYEQVFAIQDSVLAQSHARFLEKLDHLLASDIEFAKTKEKVLEVFKEANIYNRIEIKKLAIKRYIELS